ncbi:MAG: hypothetical protein AB1715_12790 [Acidobacteriota bacterium]
MRKMIGFGVAAALLTLAAAHYLGYHSFYEYKRERAAAESLEQSFPQLERNLKRAVAFSKNPLFLKELGRLYLEKALAENEFGTAAGRDAFCDLARESLEKLIRANPADGSAYFELGKVYLLYNFPLLTYAEKGRACLRRALELKPADEFLSLNILYIFLAQWDLLAKEEKEFAGGRLKEQAAANKSFMDRLRRRWEENSGTAGGLESILSALGHFLD